MIFIWILRKENVTITIVYEPHANKTVEGMHCERNIGISVALRFETAVYNWSTLFTISSHEPEVLTERSEKIELQSFVQLLQNIWKHFVKRLVSAKGRKWLTLCMLSVGTVLSLFQFSFYFCSTFAPKLLQWNKDASVDWALYKNTKKRNWKYQLILPQI